MNADEIRDAVGDHYDHGRTPHAGAFPLWHDDGLIDAFDWEGIAATLTPEPRPLSSTGWVAGRWWRVIHQAYVAADGNPRRGGVWCETSDEQEARAALLTAPSKAWLQRSFTRTDTTWQEVQ